MFPDQRTDFKLTIYKDVGSWFAVVGNPRLDWDKNRGDSVSNLIDWGEPVWDGEYKSFDEALENGLKELKYWRATYG